MSDQPVTPTGEQAGQPATPAQGQPGTAQPALDQAEAKFREFQSRADKYAQSVEERLKRAAAAFADTPTTSPAQGAPVMGGPNPTPNSVTQWARNVETVFGITLEPDDPESVLIVQGKPEDFQRSYLEAIRTKKARTSTTPQTSAPAAPAVTPTTAGGLGSATNLEAEYAEKLKKIRRGDLKAFHTLKTEYLKKGAKI
jgi:hypothetical protein